MVQPGPDPSYIVCIVNYPDEYGSPEKKGSVLFPPPENVRDFKRPEHVENYGCNSDQ